MQWVASLEQALEKTCDEVIESLSITPMQYWNESVFRYFLVRNLWLTRQGLVSDVEWKRWDLILQHPLRVKIPVEIKFWCHHGERKVQRGGPSKQNENEFLAVIDKLHNARNSISLNKDRIESAWLVLVYADLKQPRPQSFGKYYDDLSMYLHLKQTLPIRNQVDCETNTVLTCKLIEIELAPKLIQS